MLPALHAVNQALSAHTLKRLDVDYVVRAGEGGQKEVVIVDEFTGPPDARTALVRRPAPGGGGQGGHHGPEREPDARLRDLPELLPHVRQALRHDGHGRHRGPGVREDLQPRREPDPDQPSDDPQGPRGRGLQDQGARSSTPWSRRSSSATPRGSRCWSARSRSRPPRCSRASSTSGASSTTC